MDIQFEIFKSPESSFFVKYGPMLVSLISIIISASIAIYLFNKGIQKERDRFNTNRIIEKKDKTDILNKEIQGLKDQIEVLITAIIKAVSDQIDEYIAKSNEIIEHPNKRLIVASYTHENLKRLLSIDTQRVWQVFSKYNIENKEFINLYSCLDYFNKIFQKIHEDVYEGNGQITTDLMNDMIKIRNNILDISTNYIYIERGRNSNYKTNPYWILLNSIILDYYHDNDGIPDIKRDYDMLINRFKSELLKEEFKYFPTSDNILKFCKTGGDTYFSITQINKELANDILNVSGKIKEMNEKLLEINNKLKSSKNETN
jgi:hypothetical protein